MHRQVDLAESAFAQELADSIEFLRGFDWLSVLVEGDFDLLSEAVFEAQSGRHIRVSCEVRLHRRRGRVEDLEVDLLVALGSEVDLLVLDRDCFLERTLRNQVL